MLQAILFSAALTAPNCTWNGWRDPCCVVHAGHSAAQCNADGTTAGGCTWCAYADIGGCTSIASAAGGFDKLITCDKRDVPDACTAKYNSNKSKDACAEDTSTGGGCRWCTVAAWTQEKQECLSRAKAAFINTTTSRWSVGIECTP
uniref:Uncharacterized protein n=1 Tax=Prymnesium polylepis TaxID=72548 RepID=A0A7S4M341_9EUKA